MLTYSLPLLLIGTSMYNYTWYDYFSPLFRFSFHRTIVWEIFVNIFEKSNSIGKVIRLIIFVFYSIA
jgi:hypothetical protein